MSEPLTATGREVVAIYGERLLDDVIGIEIEARKTMDVERLAAARHRWMHPTYRTYSRCDCPHQAALLVEADALLREAAEAQQREGAG